MNGVGGIDVEASERPRADVDRVRIEDDVLVTKSGNRVLTSLPKQWDEISHGNCS